MNLPAPIRRVLLWAAARADAALCRANQRAAGGDDE